MISLLLYTKSNLTHYKTGGQPMEKAVSCGGVVILYIEIKYYFYTKIFGIGMKDGFFQKEQLNWEKLMKKLPYVR